MLFSLTGYYIYVEASELLKGQNIRLESEEFFTPICLHFHYHMFGKDIGELRLEQRDLKNNSTKVIWSKTGQQEDYWHSGFQAFYGERYTVRALTLELVMSGSQYSKHPPTGF